AGALSATPGWGQTPANSSAPVSIEEANRRGVEALERKDFASAIQWFRKSAEQGEVNAQFVVGTMYHRGRGVDKDVAQAIHWYRLAANQGHAKAQFLLGWAYIAELGVPKDYAQAQLWLRKSADQGDADAKAKLAELQNGLAALKRE